MSAVGASLAVATPSLNCFKAVNATPPTGPIAVAVYAWGAAIFLVWMVSIVIAMHYEHDIWGSLVSGIGTPTLLIAAINLQQTVTQ
jgi:hypothetical protein